MQHHAEPDIEDVDDGIKSERVSIAGAADGVEFEDEEPEEGGENEQDHSR